MANLRDEDDTDTGEIEVIGIADQEPDLSDLEKVVFSIQHRDGSQFSLVVGRQDGMTLSLTSDHEGEYSTVEANGEGIRTIFDGPQAWEFVIRLE